MGISGVRLEALFEAVPLAIAVFDAELRLVNANARYGDLTGVATLAPARVSIYDAFPNALADLTDHIDQALHGDATPTSARIPFQHRVGRRLIEATFAPLADEGGGRGLLFAGNDVSEREDLRETLSRNVAQLESIFDVIPDSVRVFDTDGRTVRSNSQALSDHPSGQPSTLRELWQLDRPRSIDGTSLFMHEHPTARALRGERVRGETVAVRRGADGARLIIEVNSNPLYDEHGKIRGAVTVERDVTLKTQLAKALEEEARGVEVGGCFLSEAAQRWDFDDVLAFDAQGPGGGRENSERWAGAEEVDGHRGCAGGGVGAAIEDEEDRACADALDELAENA